LAAILAGAKRDLFVHCLTEKLLIYALGRGLEYSDRAATSQIATAVPAERYKFSTLILNVVKSAPFEQRHVGAK
jgi:ribonuclease HII